MEKYEILHELGRGATGAVYAARDRATGAVVALRIVDAALSSRSDANFADRFLKHARSVSRLRHCNIVAIHDAGEAAGTVYVAMEMLEGESLRRILDRGPLPVAAAIQIARDIACGLAHAHLEGVVHAGLKPSSIIVLRSGVVKITDFAIGPLGQAAPLSPEQLRGDPVDHRCDIFALGAVFYEMLTHRPPFEGGAPKEILERMLRARPRPPSELNPHVPRALDAVVLGMLAAQPAARMPGAPVLLRELQRLEDGLGLAASASARSDDRDRIADRETFDYPKAMALMERESRRERSSGWRPAIFAALALTVLGIAVAGFMHYSSRPTAPAPLAEARADPPTAPERISPDPEPMPPEPMPAEPLPAEPSPLAQTEPATAPEAPKASPPSASPPSAADDAPAKQEPQPRPTARLILAVSPRGEIYIDGEHHGTTPPITTFDLEPGMHRIEVRSGSRRPYLTYMTVKAGDVRRIRHDFDVSRAVHPPGSRSASAGKGS